MLFFVGLTLLITCGSALGVCDEGCNEPTLIYESLKCSPIYASPSDCCPIKYDCSQFEQRIKDNKGDVCYFEGKAYAVDERVNDDDVYPNCATLVSCTKRNSDSKTEFIRAIVDCGETFNPNAGDGCHYKYELKKCCSSGKNCGPFTTTCTVNGKTYYEGMKFEHPTKKCTDCVCKEGYNGQSEEPFCSKTKCIEEVTNQEDVYSFCAPLYWQKTDCCPAYWICPQEADVKDITVTSSGDKCTYGKYKLNVGDKFSRDGNDGQKTWCECKIPPFVTCNANN